MNENQELPTCVGFIMDGNRRWAHAHGLTALEGHRKGYEALKHIIDVVHDSGIKHMVCYAFSTENWNRNEIEVRGLMELFKYALSTIGETYQNSGKNISIRFIGERARFDSSLQESMAEIENKSPTNSGLTVWVALSYGGRAEILEAVNRAVEKGDAVTEESFEKLLWTSGMPDPDLIIRTSGEERLSNFLLWQSAYSELFFTETLWPDFGEREFQSILDEYGKRQRRNGK